jgi:hypothetical protein
MIVMVRFRLIRRLTTRKNRLARPTATLGGGLPKSSTRQRGAPTSGRRAASSGGRVAGVVGSVFDLVHGVLGLRSAHDQSHWWSAWRGAELAWVCPATAAIEVVVFGVGGHPRFGRCGLARTAGLYLAVRSRLARHCDDFPSDRLVRVAVQPDRWERAPDTDRSFDGRKCEPPTSMGGQLADRS